MATDLGAYLRSKRLQAQIIRRGMADTLNMLPSRLEAIEYGQVMPSQRELEQIANFYGLTLDDLFAQVRDAKQ